MEVNVYSSIVISVAEKSFVSLNVPFAFCHFDYPICSRHMCVGSFSHSIYFGAAIWWWIIIEIGYRASNYVITWIRIMWILEKREINKNITCSLSSSFSISLSLFLSIFFFVLCNFLQCHHPLGSSQLSIRLVCLFLLVWLYPFILALLFVLISATILLLLFLCVCASRFPFL